MRIFAIALATAAIALAASAASAAPLSPASSPEAGRDIQNVRMICNEDGRCWRQRTERRVIIREGRDDAYDYAPRERYHERRSYREPGIGIDAPGVSVGIGTGRY